MIGAFDMDSASAAVFAEVWETSTIWNQIRGAVEMPEDWSDHADSIHLLHENMAK